MQRDPRILERVFWDHGRQTSPRAWRVYPSLLCAEATSDVSEVLPKTVWREGFLGELMGLTSNGERVLNY